MYAAHGFKFSTDIEACSYFNIDYEDFLKWKNTNTGGWTSVEDYPKDAALELTLTSELIDPYRENVVTEENKDSFEETRIFDTIATVTGLIVLVLILSTGFFMVSTTIKDAFLGTSIKDAVASSNYTMYSDYDNRIVTGTRIKSAMCLFKDTSVGENIEVSNNGNKELADMGYQDTEPVTNARYLATLIKDEDDTIIGIDFTLLEK